MLVAYPEALYDPSGSVHPCNSLNTPEYAAAPAACLAWCLQFVKDCARLRVEWARDAQLAKQQLLTRQDFDLRAARIQYMVGGVGIGMLGIHN